jgi:PII-like signaling protein
MRIELPEESVLLRIFISERDRYHNQPLYEALVWKARDAGLAGATVLRGPLGYGHSSHMHTAKILRLSDDLPLVVEIVETQEKIDAFLPVLDEMMESGLVTIEKARVLRYGPNANRKPATQAGKGE